MLRKIFAKTNFFGTTTRISATSLPDCDGLEEEFPYPTTEYPQTQVPSFLGYNCYAWYM